MKTIGILGGMGPIATVDLFEKIVNHTAAKTDQEHIPIIIDNNTRIPDRTEGIFHTGEDPLPELLTSCRRLENAGADFIIIACNTSHYYYDEIIREVKIPVLNILTITANKVKEYGYKKPGILGSKGVLAANLYQDAMKGAGLDYVVPEGEDRERIHALIYQGVKAGRYPKDEFGADRVIKTMGEEGADVIVLGCTELPVAAERYGWTFPTLDPTLELAKAAITFAGGQLL